jgi:hypothetical protein
VHLAHELSKLGKTDLNPAGDKADHTLAISVVAIDPIYHSSPKSNSKGGGEVYMVGNGEELLEKTAEEIQRVADEEIARAAHLAWEADKGKRHNVL